ncbi:MFS transporter [Candidatus Bathyarchaeota archaeon]|nr:MFS transporter [Candidatus Bathyarchaeota archaeon]
MAPIGKTIREMMKSRNLLVITITQSLFMLTASLWWPYWSLYILELGVSKTLLGMIFMAETIAQLIFQIPGGILTDRIGRKKMIIIGSILRATSPLVYVLTGSWQLVLCGMFITQMSNMMIPAIDALIAESTSVEHRAMGYGTFRMMTLLPQIFTPFIGGMITDALGIYAGVRLAITCTVGVAALNVIIRWKYLEDSYSTEHVTSRLDALKEIKSVPKPIWTLISVAAFASIGLRIASQFMAVYAIQIVGLTNTQWGLIMTSVGIVSTVLTIPSSVWSDKVGRKPGIMVSLGLTPLMYTGFPFSGSFITLAASRVVGAISEGFGGAVTGLEGGSAWLALVADIVPAKQRGKVMGLIATIAGALSFPGAWIGGLLWDNIGPKMPFYVSAASSTIAFLIFTLFVKEPKEKAD